MYQRCISRRPITSVKAENFSSMTLRKSFDLKMILHILHSNRYYVVSSSAAWIEFYSFHSFDCRDVVLN